MLGEKEAKINNGLECEWSRMEWGRGLKLWEQFLRSREEHYQLWKVEETQNLGGRWGLWHGKSPFWGKAWLLRARTYWKE